MNIQEFKKLQETYTDTESPPVSAFSNIQKEPLFGTVHCPYIPTVVNIQSNNFKRTTNIQMVNGDVIELDNVEYELVKPLIMQNSVHKYDFAVQIVSESKSDFDHMYVTDELISGRIKWNMSIPEIKVIYYTIKDLNIPWWKFWINKEAIVNEKNKLLWQEAVAVAHIKRLPPVPSPIKHTYG